MGGMRWAAPLWGASLCVPCLGCDDHGAAVSGGVVHVDGATVDASAEDLGIGGQGGEGGAGGAPCDPVNYSHSSGEDDPAVACSTQLRAEGGVTISAIKPSCTDAVHTHLPQSRHLVVWPEQVTRDALWLHLAGSCGHPEGSQNIPVVAALAGYRSINLAYANEVSVAARCIDPCTGASRAVDCEARVRAELIYGVEATALFEMSPHEAMVPRLVHLLKYLHAAHPDDGWDHYLSGDQPAWAHIAVSGFAQGGGMAGMISRDHPVARAVFFSKGVGAISNVSEAVDGGPACDVGTPCDRGVCCAMGDTACATAPVAGGVCVWPVPAPWAYTGRDVDGDGLGDGDETTRATPGARMYAIVHRQESAMGYSPQAFELWGMRAFGEFVNADTATAPYQGSHLLNTGIAPPNGCGAHQSIGSDACQRLDGARHPAMWDAWTYMMVDG